MHGPPFGPIEPTLHVQAVLPASESEFAGQLTQATFTLAGELRLNPELHVQAVATTLPTGELVLARHATQTESAVAPTWHTWR